VFGDVVGDLDLLRHSIPPRNSRLTRPQRSPINALARSAGIRLESIASEPVGPLASGVLTVGVETAGLPGDVGAVERAGFEAGFGGLFFGERWDVARSQQLIDELLVLADAVGEHAAVVAVVVDAPFSVLEEVRMTWVLRG
jgi:hypothetical protein